MIMRDSSDARKTAACRDMSARINRNAELQGTLGFQHLLDPLTAHRSRRDRVDSDAIFGEGVSGGSSQVHGCRLRGGIRGAPASRIPEARHRFHVDHRSAPVLDHLGNREPKSKKRAEVIDTHLLLKLINGGGCNRTVRVARATCIVGGGYQAAHTADRVAYGVLD